MGNKPITTNKPIITEDIKKKENSNQKVNLKNMKNQKETTLKIQTKKNSKSLTIYKSQNKKEHTMVKEITMSSKRKKKKNNTPTMASMMNMTEFLLGMEIYSVNMLTLLKTHQDSLKTDREEM